MNLTQQLYPEERGTSRQEDIQQWTKHSLQTFAKMCEPTYWMRLVIQPRVLNLLTVKTWFLHTDRFRSTILAFTPVFLWQSTKVKQINICSQSKYILLSKVSKPMPHFLAIWDFKVERVLRHNLAHRITVSLHTSQAPSINRDGITPLVTDFYGSDSHLGNDIQREHRERPNLSL